MKNNSDDKLPEGIGYDQYFYPLVIDGNVKIGDVSGGNGSMNRNIFSQQDQD